MKKLMFLVLMISVISITTQAQETQMVSKDSTWLFGGFAQFNLNQVALVNWAAGGDNSLSVSILGSAYANHKVGKHIWDNTFNGSWGLIRANKQIRKNEDRLELNSLYGYNIKKNLYASALMNFKSQFSHTSEFVGDTDTTIRISKFGAPAYLQIGAGITYKPKEWFSLYLSPTTGKMTFVRPDAQIDETRYGLAPGDKVRAEFGAYMSARLTYEIFKNVNLATSIDVFNNYTDPNKPNRKNFDVDWQVRIDMKVNKYLSASILTQLLYDNDTKVPIDTNGDGELDDVGVRTQFKEALGVALVYRFSGSN